jgi:phosphohistidine swiveling domain-containing protein
MDLCANVVTALPNRSVQMNRDLHDLAQHDEHTIAFADALAVFLKRYGHRSFYLDIYHPTFADEPAQVLDLVERVKARSDDLWDERVAMRQEALRALHQALGRDAWGWLKRAIFDHVLYLAQRYLPLREDQRFYWQRTLAQMRRFFLLLGKQLAESGMLHGEAHIFFLTRAEVEAYVRGHGQGDRFRYAQLAASRQQQFVRLCQDSQIAPERAYPPFLRGNEPWIAGGDESAVRFQGRGISPGLGQGRVVTVRSPAEFGKIQRGDVLVAAGVDPGWTPIFGLLSALVLERGGQLSHAAVMAREYGLPAVAGIPGICASLRDGDVVLVDGQGGWVSRVAQL